MSTHYEPRPEEPDVSGWALGMIGAAAQIMVIVGFFQVRSGTSSSSRTTDMGARRDRARLLADLGADPARRDQNLRERARRHAADMAPFRSPRPCKP